MVLLLCVCSYFLPSIYCKTLDMDWLLPDVNVRVLLPSSNIPHFYYLITFKYPLSDYYCYHGACFITMHCIALHCIALQCGWAHYFHLVNCFHWIC